MPFIKLAAGASNIPVTAFFLWGSSCVKNWKLLKNLHIQTKFNKQKNSFNALNAYHSVYNMVYSINCYIIYVIYHKAPWCDHCDIACYVAPPSHLRWLKVIQKYHHSSWFRNQEWFQLLCSFCSNLHFLFFCKFSKFEFFFILEILNPIFYKLT